MAKPKSKAASEPSTPPKARRVTLKDVAAAVGVSHVAVSLALRGSPEIPPATTERILKAARELRYVPDESARRLKGQAPGRIAYVASRLAHGFVGQVLVGMEQRAFETRKYFNAIQPFSTWFQTEARDEILRRILFGGLADAVVLVSAHPRPEMVRDFKRHGVPLVLVEDKAPGCHSVRVDNVLGARLAAKQLLALGCARPALISGIRQGKGLDLNPTVLERRRGFDEALRAAKLKPENAPSAEVAYYDIADGRRALDELLAQSRMIDGVFCAAGDLVAMGLLERARELGIKVPKDLKVIGYDDIDAARLLQPALSTVRQPVRELGAQAFDLAVAAAEGRLAEETHLLFKPELVLRGTT